MGEKINFFKYLGKFIILLSYFLYFKFIQKNLFVIFHFQLSSYLYNYLLIIKISENNFF